MEGSGKATLRVGQWLAAVIIGMLAGSIIITPVGAHLNSPLTFSHLKKHFYTKKVANASFINVGEKAFDSDKLDGKDSADFLGVSGKAADADKVDGKSASDLAAAGVFVQNVGGNLAIHRWFNNVNGQPPTLSLIDPGYYAINFGFDARSRYSVCSIDPNNGTTRNAVCTTGVRWYAATPDSNIEVSLVDPDGDGPAEFNLLVF